VSAFILEAQDTGSGSVDEIRGHAALVWFWPVILIAPRDKGQELGDAIFGIVPVTLLVVKKMLPDTVWKLL
jgi:hypothetical protein